MKNKPVPTTADLVKAMQYARGGRAGKLVDIIRSFSREDLVAGLSATGGDLISGLHYAAGRKEFRQTYRRRGQS